MRSSSVRVRASGSPNRSSRSSRSVDRSRGSTDSGCAVVATTATPDRPSASRIRSTSTVATGGGVVAGSSASTSVTSRTAGVPAPEAVSPGAAALSTAAVPPVAAALSTAAVNRDAAASGSSAANPGASTSTTGTRRAWATERTSVALPTPSGPDTSTPRRREVPSVARRSGRSKANSNHSPSLRAADSAPARSASGTAFPASSACSASPGSADPAGLPAAPVGAVVVAAVVAVSPGRVAGPSGAGVCGSRQVTTVARPTATAPSGSVAVTVSSSLVQVAPTARDRVPRTAGTSEPGGGARSCGSSDTASPTVSTFPIRASRRVCSGTDRRASREPETVTRRAARTSQGRTRTSAPSATPTLPIVTSSASRTPGAAPAGAGAASATLTRAPVSRTASQARSPSASSTSRCSRTTPRRVSNADAVCRTVRVSCGALTSPG